MGNRTAALLLLLILCFVLVSTPEINVGKAESNTIVIPDDYASIQEAIDNADEGDTIFVKKGTYEIPINQTLIINKPISFMGEDAATTKLILHPPLVITTIITQTFTSYASPIDIKADDVKLSGFTISSDGGDISTTGSRTQITGNVINVSVQLRGSHQSVSENNLTASLTCGECTHGTVYKNNVVNGSIGIASGSYNIIFANNISGGTLGAGGESSNNLIYGNIVQNSREAHSGGIWLASPGTIVSRNIVSYSNTGVAIHWGGEHTVSCNIVANCEIGLYKTETHGGNIFYANYVVNNSYGAKIAYRAPSSETILYRNNFINNVQQVNSDPTETIGGSSGVPELTRSLHHTGLFDNGTEGNFWNDYKGTDSNGDGIGDTPYIIDENRADNYPLMSPFNISSITIELPEWATNQLSNLNISPDITFSTNWEQIIPEFPSWIILPIFVTATLFALIIKKRLFYPRSRDYSAFV